MIESNTVIIFDNDKNLIRKTVAGHDLEDIDEVTGEPRRIVYHWPIVYDDPAERRITPPPAPDAPPAQHHGANRAPEAGDDAGGPAVSFNHDRPSIGASASARRTDR
jgi:hypothetical protein